MDSKTIVFQFEKETKNTYRYVEVTTEAPIIGTLYLKKYAAPDCPKLLSITISDKPNA